MSRRGRSLFLLRRLYLLDDLMSGGFCWNKFALRKNVDQYYRNDNPLFQYETYHGYFSNSQLEWNHCSVF